MEKLEHVINGLEESYQRYSVVEGQGILVDHDGYEYALIDPVLIIDAIALLKAQEPSHDWISRKRLKDEIQYYIDEAGWGEEINRALGWCLEFIDNQEAVKWE